MTRLDPVPPTGNASAGTSTTLVDKGITVKGVKINATQAGFAESLVAIGTSQNAPTIAKQACIFAAIMESDLGLNMGWDTSNPNYGGILAGNTKYFAQYGSASSIDVTDAEAQAFYAGGNGYQDGAIAAASQYTDPAKLGTAVEAPFDSNDPPPWGQYIHQGGIALINQVRTEAKQIVAALGAGLSGGGAFGLSGSGTPGGTVSASLWTVGDSSNPDQDYFTTISQYCQDAQWYGFSDGETFFVADGIEIMAQTPVATVTRLAQDVLPQTNLSWDNTSWAYVTTHTEKTGVKRRTALAKMTSPTQVTLRFLGKINEIIAGDTVLLLGWGPADGVWLVGQWQRDVFMPYSDLTLVQGTAPLNSSSGLPTGPAYRTGAQIAQVGSGYSLAAMITEAKKIDAARLPYKWGGGHLAAGTPSDGKALGAPNASAVGPPPGFDCSGAVAAVLVAGGCWQQGTPVGLDSSIPTKLIQNAYAAPGAGDVSQGVTIYDNPGVHIFMRINGRIWGTADGSGHVPPNSPGGGYIPDGVPGGPGFQAFHILPSVLGQQATSVSSNTT